jgi:very-short-patch-repair endonuclease
MSKLTQNEFIKKCNSIHNYIYDYSLVKYTNSKYKIKIICDKHGVFEQRANAHSMGQGCPKCSCERISKLISYNNEIFIQKSNQKHDFKYDYSSTDYKNSRTKVKIICKKHGIFEQQPDSHLSGCGCPFCANKSKIGKYRLGLEKFIRRSIEKHGDKYDYSLVDYKGDRKHKVKIKCKNGHIFEMMPHDHLSGNGCKFCSGYYPGNNNRFIKKAKNIHGDRYDYSLMEYKRNKVKVKIICNKCKQIFEVSPSNHIHLERGCPNCLESKGEKKIISLLEKHNIRFEKQKRFNNCKYKKTLPFDFYLEDYNTCIEFDGKQHYENTYYNRTEFENIQIRDKIKTKYCLDKNINLIRIRYDESIEEKLKHLMYK